MRYLVIAGLAISAALALSPKGSFRYQSTAYLFEDDYDLLFDPARIPLIEGSRVYTNLSNFISNQEEHFSARTEDYLLIGGSTDLIAYIYPGFVLDKYCSKEALPTGLFGQTMFDTLKGDARTVETEWLDIDNNGTYDHRVTRVNEKKAWNDSTDIDYYFGIGYKVSDLRLGLSFFNTNSSFTFTNPYYNWLYDRRDSSLISNALTYTVNDTFSGPDKYKTDSKRFIISGWYEFETFSIGLMTGINPISRDSNYVHTGSSFENRSPANPLVQDYMKTTMVDSFNKPWTGTNFPIGLSIFAYPMENMESRFYLNFFTRQEELGSDAASQQHNTMDSTGQPGYAHLDAQTWHKYRGDLSNKGINFSTKQLFEVSERFDLGFGLELGAWDWQDSLVDTMWSLRVYEYNNGDTISGVEDYRVTTTSSDEWVKKVSGVKKLFSIPVGFDFKLVPSLSLRLGAIHSITWTDITTTGRLSAFEPVFTRTEYGDSTFFERVGPQSELQATSETINTIEHNTYFTYGAGFNPIKNLQIDIMGFRNLTNLSNWKLSITFKF
ncbi:MAG: hypothetical protein OEZ20_07160 [candidate division WOR-3 bacterium]|nr:hypothetical protein [candidate division WOR-3 bacterium]